MIDRLFTSSLRLVTLLASLTLPLATLYFDSSLIHLSGHIRTVPLFLTASPILGKTHLDPFELQPVRYKHAFLES